MSQRVEPLRRASGLLEPNDAAEPGTPLRDGCLSAGRLIFNVLPKWCFTFSLEETRMFNARVLLATSVLGVACSVTFGAWSVFDTGAWPRSWPKELEPLRKQASTIQGGLLELPIHRIPFADRNAFEEAWPHLLKIKTDGAPIILVRSSSSHWHFGETRAGVLIHCPPGGLEPKVPAEPIQHVDSIAERWLNTTYIELVVDGEIVDLNRIPLPTDTPIIDQRFEQGQNKAVNPSGGSGGK